MRKFRLRTDLERSLIGEFALPLGIVPVGLDPPSQGYTLSYATGEGDDPDAYSFHVVVSHERISPILHRAYELLPDHVFAILEIGSRDAYRSTDVFIGEESVTRSEFTKTWKKYEPFFLEDGSIASGANSDEPFVEVFLDQWKGISIHVPLEMREDVEKMLHEFDLEEVVNTWPGMSQDDSGDGMSDNVSKIRPVLDLSHEDYPDVDELLLDLRHQWNLELNVDRESNVDESGRELGQTLWHAVVIVDHESDQEQGAYASIWATASSLDEMDQLIERSLEHRPPWILREVYTVDRVAFDERPDELADISPRNRQAEIHLVTVEPWGQSDGDNEKSSQSSIEEDD